MIKCHCRTNIDKWRMAIWPTMFAQVPMKGDYVQGTCGQYKPLLKVHMVIYTDAGVTLELHEM